LINRFNCKIFKAYRNQSS